MTELLGSLTHNGEFTHSQGPQIIIFLIHFCGLFVVLGETLFNYTSLQCTPSAFIRVK
jgi:hypothetical protein